MLILIIPALLWGQENKSLPQNDSEFSTNFELGIRDEIMIMYGKDLNKKVAKSTLPINFHLAAGVRFLKHYKADLRFGFNYAFEDFMGFDAGIYLLADLFNTDIFATAGIDHFQVAQAGHGYTYTGGAITFYCFGLGYNTSKKFELDIIYCIPDRKIYGHDGEMGIHMNETYYKIVDGLLKIGFQYSFIF